MLPSVPPLVQERARALGAVGDVWLAGLPDLVLRLSHDWDVVFGEPLLGGTAGYVARVTRADGTAAVAKLAIPDEGFAQQLRTLRAADGHGYVQVLAHDSGRSAVLLEELGPSLGRCGLAPEAQLETLALVLRDAWTVSAEAAGAVAHDKGASLAELVDDLASTLDHGLPAGVVDRAMEFAGRRSQALDLGSAVLVHGDAAAANVLEVLHPRPGAATGFVLVDGEGFVGDPTYDLGVALRDWCAELTASADPAVLARGYCAVLARTSGLDPQAIWEWGYLERVSTGLFVLSFHAPEVAEPFFQTATVLVDA